MRVFLSSLVVLIVSSNLSSSPKNTPVFEEGFCWESIIPRNARRDSFFWTTTTTTMTTMMISMIFFSSFLFYDDVRLKLTYIITRTNNNKIGTFVVAFGLEHYMHHKYHSHHDEHHHDETHGGGKGEGANENKTHQSHSPKEFSAETASLDEITKEMTRLRERVGELRKEGKHV